MSCGLYRRSFQSRRLNERNGASPMGSINSFHTTGMIVTNTYPIYILDLHTEERIVFPKEKADISHSEFWEQTVAPIIAEQFSIPLRLLLNLPYCQRRARVTAQGLVFFGETHSAKLLKKISKATGETDLRWAYDEHETRLSFDVLEFKRLLARGDDRKSP